jgi:hypothetical protein
MVESSANVLCALQLSPHFDRVIVVSFFLLPRVPRIASFFIRCRSRWLLLPFFWLTHIHTSLLFFLAFIIQSYGSVLSPLPGADEQGNLSRTLGSVVGVACLRTEGRVGPQLTSHVFGLLRARNAQNLSEEDRWLASDEGTEWVIRTIDTLLDVVMTERAEERGRVINNDL